MMNVLDAFSASIRDLDAVLTRLEAKVDARPTREWVRSTIVRGDRQGGPRWPRRSRWPARWYSRSPDQTRGGIQLASMRRWISDTMVSRSSASALVMGQLMRAS